MVTMQKFQFLALFYSNLIQFIPIAGCLLQPELGIFLFFEFIFTQLNCGLLIVAMQRFKLSSSNTIQFKLLIYFSLVSD